MYCGSAMMMQLALEWCLKDGCPLPSYLVYCVVEDDYCTDPSENLFMFLTVVPATGKYTPKGLG